MAPSRHTTSAQTETRAFASLFLGIASFAFGPLTGIPAIALGSAARRKLAESPSDETDAGRTLAGAGTLAGFFGMGFFAVFVLWLGSSLLTPDAAAKAPALEDSTAQAKLAAPAPPHAERHLAGVEMMHSSR